MDFGPMCHVDRSYRKGATDVPKNNFLPGSLRPRPSRTSRAARCLSHVLRFAPSTQRFEWSMPVIGKPPHEVYERRVDGDRITEMIPAREWLTRNDMNPMQRPHNSYYPPSLPRYASRDHLHDRNREMCVFDTANPGLEAYVRVTRRRHNDPMAELQLKQTRKARVREHFQAEQIEARDANELLELRSQNLRQLIAARSRGWQRPAGGEDHSMAARQPRIDELEKRLQAYRNTYTYTGYTKASAQSPPMAGPRAVRTSPTKTASGNVVLRGGWPVDTLEA